MGHKVHPNAFRLGPFRSWEANWFATEKDYTKLLHEDLDMRRLILSRLRNAGIARPCIRLLRRRLTPQMRVAREPITGPAIEDARVQPPPARS